MAQPLPIFRSRPAVEEPARIEPQLRAINLFEATALVGVEKQMAAMLDMATAITEAGRASGEVQQAHLREQFAEMQKAIKQSFTDALTEMRGTMERTIAERNEALQLAMTERNAPIEILERDGRGRISKLRKGSRDLPVTRGPDGRAVRLG